MATYTNISGDVTNQVLITKGGNVGGGVRKMTIVNTHNSNTQVTTIDLYDGSNTYVLYNKIAVPAGTTLVLTDNLSFQSRAYNLRITTTGSSSSTIIMQ